MSEKTNSTGNSDAKKPGRHSTTNTRPATKPAAKPPADKPSKPTAARKTRTSGAKSAAKASESAAKSTKKPASKAAAKTPATPAPTAATPTPATLPNLYHLPADAELNRISVTELRPMVEDGLFPAKAAVGELFPVHATVFVDGHSLFGADAVLLRPVDPKRRGEKGYDLYAPAGTPEGAPDPGDPAAWEVVDRARMYEIGAGENQYEAWLQPNTVGRYAFAVESWIDPYGTWVHDAKVKIPAGIDVELTLEEGARLLERAIAGEAKPAYGSARDTATPAAPLPAADAAVLQGAIAGLREKNRRPQVRLSAATNELVANILAENPLRDLVTRTKLCPLRVDRARSVAGAWYEIFPRSIGSYYGADGQIVPGTLRTAAEILPEVAADGFDVIYLTPVHPIGHAFRKGRNNSLVAGPNDPGSPWAIGNEHGGHDAVDPDLGGIEAFDEFAAAAKRNHLEIALDFALQCSPDHPWVKAHPEWFSARADGSIAYAENPPKKYQDIYPLNFDHDPDGLYAEIRRVIEFWIDHGVTIFRMDNPHTKPVRFWQRLAADLHQTHPEVVMLSEAFTAPAMMRGLAKAGFHLSYTYFTWRNSKTELTEYFEELAYETAHVLRPALFPMTPDILTDYMTAGVAAFNARALLAATGAPTWGILGGSYEFCEHVQRPGVEEVNDNPKYEVKVYDWAARDKYGIASLLRTLNAARSAHPALMQLRNIKFHAVENDAIIAYSKHIDAVHSPTGRADTVLVIVNLDPHNTQTGWVHLDLPSLGLCPEDFPELAAPGEGQRLFVVRDELTGAEYTWGRDNFVQLNPYIGPGHILSFSPIPD
ncbi:maltotransferase domain-containing protein [uncultured Mobiluncus sp.]|uniref:maltotransferase domain-containing protein n=1 Tax=uncultured Mobiluncus sp. TaxID=293425 RepID=UPI0025EC93E7|nr:maltotransferase domain-containing protein [uncultured Mobiluncus sp.]